MPHEQMISFHGYFLFLLIDHTDRSHVNETLHPISATPHRGFYFLNPGRFSQIPADCHFRAPSIDFSPHHSSFTASLLVIPVSSVFGYQRKVYYSFCFGDFVSVWRQKCWKHYSQNNVPSVFVCCHLTRLQVAVNKTSLKVTVESQTASRHSGSAADTKPEK